MQVPTKRTSPVMTEEGTMPPAEPSHRLGATSWLVNLGSRPSEQTFQALLIAGWCLNRTRREEQPTPARPRG
jgi:hypothetical protein